MTSQQLDYGAGYFYSGNIAVGFDPNFLGDTSQERELVSKILQAKDPQEDILSNLKRIAQEALNLVPDFPETNNKPSYLPLARFVNEIIQSPAEPTAHGCYDATYHTALTLPYAFHDSPNYVKSKDALFDLVTLALYISAPDKASRCCHSLKLVPAKKATLGDKEFTEAIAKGLCVLARRSGNDDEVHDVSMSDVDDYKYSRKKEMAKAFLKFMYQRTNMKDDYAAFNSIRYDLIKLVAALNGYSKDEEFSPPFYVKKFDALSDLHNFAYALTC